MNILKYFLFSSFLILAWTPGFLVFAHGVIESPPSRQQFCGVESKPDEIYREKMTHEKCRPIMTKSDGSLDNSIYNFMAVLTHTTGRSDKIIEQLPIHVCGFNSENWGGGKTPWDNAIDWPSVFISSGKQNFIWNISWGNHFSDTEEFVYWITKEDYNFDPNKELKWNDFEQAPFCKLYYDDRFPKANPNIIPDKIKNRFTTICNVPKRQNRAVIYGEWGRNKSTYERFHSCIDVQFNNDSSPVDIKAFIKPLPETITGRIRVELDGSQSIGSNLTYNWSIDADNLTPYQLTDSQSAKAYLSLDNIYAQQNVMVNLTIKQDNAIAHSSIKFTHLPVITAVWQLVGKASIATTLKSGDKIQLRLVDNNGKDYYIPTNPLILDEDTSKPENWAYALAGLINDKNNLMAKMGILSEDNKTIEPIKSADENRIYVPTTSNIKNSYIHIIQANTPSEMCIAKRKDGSGSYWLGYDVFTERAPFILDFSKTGIDLTKIIIAPGVFSDIKILGKYTLLINKKPDWVSKTVPGYLGFHGPNYGSYDPFNNTVTALCEINNII
jgi:chitin-binding protein